MHASAKQLHVFYGPLGFMASASSTLQAHRDVFADTHVTLVATLLSYGHEKSSIISYMFPQCKFNSLRPGDAYMRR